MPASRRPAASRPATSRRGEIVRLAAALFAERGFGSVTVDDIGAAAGVSGPALYHHFDGKEALLGEMLVGISKSLLDRGRALAASSSGPALIDELIAMHVDFALDDRALITVHFRDLVHASEADRRQVRTLQNAYVDIWVSALTDAGVADRRAARAAVHAVLGLVNSTPFSARLKRDEMQQMLITMASAALSSVTAAAPRHLRGARSA